MNQGHNVLPPTQLTVVRVSYRHGNESCSHQIQVFKSENTYWFANSWYTSKGVVVALQKPFFFAGTVSIK